MVKKSYFKKNTFHHHHQQHSNEAKPTCRCSFRLFGSLLSMSNPAIGFTDIYNKASDKTCHNSNQNLVTAILKLVETNLVIFFSYTLTVAYHSWCLLVIFCIIFVQTKCLLSSEESKGERFYFFAALHWKWKSVFFFFFVERGRNGTKKYQTLKSTILISPSKPV